MPVIFELFYLVWFILFLEQKKKTKTKLRKGGFLKEGGINRDSKNTHLKWCYQFLVIGHYNLFLFFQIQYNGQCARCGGAGSRTLVRRRHYGPGGIPGGPTAR